MAGSEPRTVLKMGKGFLLKSDKVLIKNMGSEI